MGVEVLLGAEEGDGMKRRAVGMNQRTAQALKTNIEKNRGKWKSVAGAG
jgi:hypothetical protein